MLLSSSVLLNTFFALCLLLAPSTAPQTTSDRFDLRGKVINAVTGEPVSGALVQRSDPEICVQPIRWFIRFYKLVSRSGCSRCQKARIFRRARGHPVESWDVFNDPCSIRWRGGRKAHAGRNHFRSGNE